MRIGCYVCRCGPGLDGQISSCIDPERLLDRLRSVDGEALGGDIAYAVAVDVACTEAGQEEIAAHLRENRPDRVVVAACSPREHGVTFQRVLREAGMNPYLLHLANIREHVAWVTTDPAAALDKAEAYIRAGAARAARQQPLEHEERPVCTDVLVIGAGPAGHRAALTLAEAGRRVILVEKSPILGGVTVRIEDLFPTQECAPCLMEPVTGELLHGEFPGPIETKLLSDVVSLKGSIGNFTVGIRRRPRFVTADCVGCGECVSACPVSVTNPINFGRSERKAIDFEIFGGLPSIPVLDAAACSRFSAADATAADGGCTACRDACPLDDIIDFDDAERMEEHTVGAVVVAVGAEQFDARSLPGLGYGDHPDVLTGWEFERLLAANGPTGGQLLTHDGRVPRTIAVVNCAGSLEAEHVPYCSGICCQLSLKFHHMITKKSPDTEVVCYYKQVVVPGKEAFENYEHARRHPGTRWERFEALAELRVRTDGGLGVVRTLPDGGEQATDVDLVVLMTPSVGGAALRELSRTLDIGLDQTGFLRSVNERAAATRSTMRGIFIAGSCQAPMDLPSAMTQGAAAAGQALAALVEGRKLTLEAVTAAVDPAKCSGCLSCLLVCPYSAIDRTPDGTVAVDTSLCTGCGTCVAACPTKAMTSRHFTDEALLAEIREVLR